MPKEELKKKKFVKNIFKWKDIDLVNKITAINKMANSGIFDNNNIMSDYKKIHKNDTDKKLTKSQSEINTSHLSQSVGNITQRLLLPLVIKGNDVCKEELKIEEQLEEEYKKEKKRQLLLETKKFTKKKLIDKFESKYPLLKKNI